MALTIDSIKQRLFNPTKHEKTVNRTSNPFAQPSFTGKTINILNADVFSSEKSSLSEKMQSKSKLALSTLVGSISSFGSKINSKLESVVAFGNRMKENAVSTWNYLRDTKLEDVVKAKFEMMSGQYNPDKLAAKYSPAELGEMWKSEMSLEAIG